VSGLCHSEGESDSRTAPPPLKPTACLQDIVLNSSAVASSRVGPWLRFDAAFVFYSLIFYSYRLFLLVVAIGSAGWSDSG
jgi:hypothetical protein